jgi:hypothetical protein
MGSKRRSGYPDPRCENIYWVREGKPMPGVIEDLLVIIGASQPEEVENIVVHVPFKT